MSGSLALPHAEAVERAWREAAAELGGRYGVNPAWKTPGIRVDGTWGVILLESMGGDAGYLTRARAVFQSSERVNLAVSAEGFLASLGKSLGFVQDIELGHPEFDRRFLARGFPPARVKELLAPPVVDLVLAQPFVGIRLGSPGLPPHPPGLRELEVRRTTIVRDAEQLVGMVRIAEALIPRLDPLAGPVRGDTAQLVERLAGVGGVVREHGFGGLVWEGDPPRREAARLLGESGDRAAVPPLIEALGDRDAGVVIAAIGALEQLGAQAAVPRLVRLLGHRDDAVEGRTPADHAADALTTLGHGAVAEAVAAALRGEPDGLAAAIGPWRDEVVAAFMRVLASFDLEARVEAARALGVLGAREALPLLREKSRAMGLRTRLSTAAREAVDAIEAQASLPRPAPAAPDAADGPNTLPRPADAGDRADSDRTLPRPSSQRPSR